MSTLLAEFGDLMGIELKFDENKQCLLSLDDSLLISIQWQDPDFLLYGMLGDFPDEQKNEFWKSLLEFNRHLSEKNEGSISLDSATDSLLLIKHIAVNNLDAVTLKNIVENFISTQERLIEYFATQDHGTGALSASPARPSVSSPSDQDDFLHISVNRA